MTYFLWTEDYRPHKIDDCILPEDLKNTFKAYRDKREIPNIILWGPSGTGKTSMAKALLDELDLDYIVINSSKERGIDTLRDKVMNFVSTVSFKDGRKYVILDEADGMTNDLQQALRGFMEEYASNAGFIFTCNNIGKISDAIISRTITIDFTIPKSEFTNLAKSFYTILLDILQKEGYTFDVQAKPVLAQMIKSNFPDWRKMLNILQSYAVQHGKIDTGLLGKKLEIELSGLINSIKEKRWSEIRKWVGENYYFIGSFADFSRALIKQIELYLTPDSLPLLICLINDYDERESRVSDRELNVTAMLTKIMMEVSWK